jgi:LacI family transcriptional regulator
MRSKSVALHMSLNTFHRLDIAQGAVQYAREHTQWRIFGSFYTSRPILNYQTWAGDGIIAICHHPEDAQEILATGLPIIDVVQGFFDRRIVNVTCDNLEAGRRAGRHLRFIGFRRFALCQLEGLHWAGLRGEGFSEAVGVPLSDMPVFARRISWWQNHRQSRALESFLQSLPSHTAILAANDNAGAKVTAACQNCGRKVPDDLSVMGIDGDDLQCELSYPALSTVPINGKRIGYEAARKLDALIRGGKGVSRDHIQTPPKEVVVRASSDTVFCDDEAVRRAVRFIREHYSARISVSDVA